MLIQADSVGLDLSSNSFILRVDWYSIDKKTEKKNKYLLEKATNGNILNLAELDIFFEMNAAFSLKKKKIWKINYLGKMKDDIEN